MRIMAVFLLLVVSMGASLAKSITEGGNMKDMNERGKAAGVLRSANSGNGFNPGKTGESGFNPGNQKPDIPDFVPDETLTNQGNGESGYNPGNQGNGWTGGSGFHPGNTGQDQKPSIPDFVPDESITNQGNGESGYNPGNTGGSGFNPGNTGGSGYNPGYTGGSGFHPGDQTPHIPDFVPDESITNQGNGQTGYNPGVTGGSGFNPGNRPGDSGFHPGSQRPNSPDETIIVPGSGSSGYNPGATEGSGFHPGSSGGYNSGSKSGGRRTLAGNKTRFRTPIVFADDEDLDTYNISTQMKTKSALSPYQPGGDKTPYLRGKPDKHTKPVSEENLPRQIKPFSTTRDTTFQPWIETIPSNIAPAQTLPGQIQFASVAKYPYVTGQNTQQTYQQDDDIQNYILLNSLKQTQTSDQLNVQLLLVQNPVSGIFDQTAAKQPYISGQNKQQYLRGRQTKPFHANSQEIETPAYILLNPNGQTKPFQSNRINSQSSQILQSPVQFDGLPGNGFTPITLVQNPVSGAFARTLPSPIQFAQPAAKQPYILGQNNQQYLRGRQTKPVQVDSQENETPNYILLRQTEPFHVNGQNIISVPQSIPGQAHFSDNTQTKPFLSYQADADAASFLPGVSTRPRFPPGYTQPAAARNVHTEELPTAVYGGPKTVLYIF